MKKGVNYKKIEVKSHSILLGQNLISKVVMPIPEKRSKVTFLAICFLIGWYFALKVLAIGLLEFNVSSDLIQHVELGLACSWLFTNTTVLPRFQNVFMNVLEHWKKCSWAENVFWICSKLCYMFRDFVMNKDT